MARSNDNLKFTGLAVVVIAAAFGVGYFVLGGQHNIAPADTQIVPVSAPQTDTKASVQNPVQTNITPRQKNSDYTAPGAPAIRIAEERTPSLTVTHIKQTAAPTDTQTAPADTEASQEASSPTPVSAGPGDSTETQSSGTTDTSSAPQTTPLIPPPAPATQSAAPTVPAAGGDFEHIGAHSAPATPDSSASGKAQFRVQAGTFATSDNARALADNLHSRGYTATTHAEQTNGKTVYKVQVGAYRTRAAADKAAADLQKTGYPAYTAPIDQ